MPESSSVPILAFTTRPVHLRVTTEPVPATPTASARIKVTFTVGDQTISVWDIPLSLWARLKTRLPSEPCPIGIIARDEERGVRARIVLLTARHQSGLNASLRNTFEHEFFAAEPMDEDLGLDEHNRAGLRLVSEIEHPSREDLSLHERVMAQLLQRAARYFGRSASLEAFALAAVGGPAVPDDEGTDDREPKTIDELAAQAESLARRDPDAEADADPDAPTDLENTEGDSFAIALGAEPSDSALVETPAEELTAPEQHVTMFVLGSCLRPAAYRRHPRDLAAEAMDMVHRIISGPSPSDA